MTFTNQQFSIGHCQVSINNDQLTEVDLSNNLLTHWLNQIHQHLTPYGADHLTEIDISFLTPKQIQAVNLTHGKKNQTTNVLSFTYKNDNNPPKRSGEILLCPQILKEELPNWPNQTLTSHYFHLLLHAYLHILDFDHNNEKNTKKMQTTESNIIQNMNYPDPYVIL